MASNPLTERVDFEMASRAFDLFTLAERRCALEYFAKLRFPSIADRFIDAVHFVITQPKAKDGE